MKAAGITLSTVGAGGGSNPFLEGLAEQGGGRFYDAANPASIPDIFLKETQQVSGQQIIEEPFFPIQTSSSPILRGLEDGLPRLLGYNGTTIKSAAQTVLVTARDDPLLAQWQYGLGRSVAWTSDSTGRWARDWVGWQGFSRFFSQLVSLDVPGRGDRRHRGGVRDARRPDDACTSRASRPTARRATSTRRRPSVVGPDFSTGEVELDQVAPGVYEAPLGEIESGRLRRAGHPDAARLAAARADGRARRADRGRVPAARRQRAVPGRAARRRPAGARSRRRSSPGRTTCTHDLAFTELWPLAADPGPAAVAARHRPAARLDRTARVRGSRAWVRDLPRRRRVTAGRTATGESLLAARARATSAETRAALLRPPESVPATPSGGGARSDRAARHGAERTARECPGGRGAGADVRCIADRVGRATDGAPSPRRPPTRSRGYATPSDARETASETALSEGRGRRPVAAPRSPASTRRRAPRSTRASPRRHPRASDRPKQGRAPRPRRAATAPR